MRFPFKKRRRARIYGYGGYSHSSTSSWGTILPIVIIVLVVAAGLFFRSRQPAAPTPQLVTLSAHEQILEYRCPSGSHSLVSMIIEVQDLPLRVKLRGGNE